MAPAMRPTTEADIAESLRAASPEAVAKWREQRKNDLKYQPPTTPEIGNESFLQKLARKTKQDPFVPMGALLTCGILAGGLYQFNKGNKENSQRMMRFRILAQGATVVAMVAGMLGTNMDKLFSSGSAAQ